MSTAPEATVITVPLSLIDYGTRKREDFGNLEELKASIQERGLLHNLVVKRSDNSRFLLLAGGRRWRALTELGVREVPVRVFEHELSDLEVKLIELEENYQRKDFTWAEEVSLKAEIHEIQTAIHGVKTSTAQDAKGWNATKTAEYLGESVGTISQDLALADILKQVPEIAQACQNKTDAFKLVKKLQKGIETKAVAEAAVAKQASTPLEVLRRQIMNNYMLGDCLVGMKSVPAGTIDLVEIDPPYSIDLNTVKFCYAKGDGQHDQLNKEDYNEIPAADYLEFMEKVLREAYRCMKEDSFLLLWFGQEPWFQPMLDLLRKTGFKVRGIPNIWVKPVGQTLTPKYNLGAAYETFFVARKGMAEIKKQGRLNTFCYNVVPATSRLHPTERPVEMIQDVLETYTAPGSKVMIPFAGSGNTLLAAYNIGCSAVGWDLTENYRNGFIERVTKFMPNCLQNLKEGKQL